ncbi:pentapeptide repeat-containing protein [Rhodopseudomonas palustris]|uniref:Pentapeptide repeat protein n=1 Tax=Rhodopseudomonas palustris (strain DX-1) TaxID=652103 RepID=E6VMG9_RHOPX|nr:pentapeptide repeat-containing protein [Rhodopseudomonas palustris]QDL99339.1 pentapeptide repeat-containing protein [Rhodopseudomonas palustris]
MTTPADNEPFSRILDEIVRVREKVAILADGAEKEQARRSTKAYSIICKLRDHWVTQAVLLSGAIGGILSVWNYLRETDNRHIDRVVSAWQLLAQPGGGNLGKKDALEYLNTHDCLLGRAFGSSSWLSKLSYWGSAPRCIYNLTSTPDQISKTDFSGLDLAPKQKGAFVSLAGATLHSPMFDRSDLSAVDFGGATLVDARFENTMLSGASLSSSNLKNLFFSGDANCLALNGATVLDSSFFGSLRRAEILGTNFKNFQLSRMDAQRSLVSESRFIKGELFFVDLTSAVIDRTKFENVRIINSAFTAADLSGSSFLRAHFGVLDREKYGWKASHSHPFRDANLTNAHFEETSFDDVDLEGSYYCLNGSRPVIPASYSGPMPQPRDCSVVTPSISYERWHAPEGATYLDGTKAEDWLTRKWQDEDYKDCRIETIVSAKTKWRG